MADSPTLSGARDQVVTVLNARANKCLVDKVANVHCEKGVSVAQITPDDAKSFCRRWHPEKYERIVAELDQHPETVYFDVEALLTGIEGLLPYQVMRRVAKTGVLDAPDDKAHLACLFAMHYLRSSAIVQTRLELTRRMGRPTFEYFWWMKTALSHPPFLIEATAQVALAQWHLYHFDAPVLALPDTPVLIDRSSVMLALSPHLLVEVMNAPGSSAEHYFCHQSPHKSKLREYRRRAIASTFKELICATLAVANEYVETAEWRGRVERVANLKSAVDLVREVESNKLHEIVDFLGPESPRAMRELIGSARARTKPSTNETSLNEPVAQPASPSRRDGPHSSQSATAPADRRGDGGPGPARGL